MSPSFWDHQFSDRFCTFLYRQRKFRLFNISTDINWVIYTITPKAWKPYSSIFLHISDIFKFWMLLFPLMISISVLLRINRSIFYSSLYFAFVDNVAIYIVIILFMNNVANCIVIMQYLYFMQYHFLNFNSTIHFNSVSFF